MFQRIYAIYFTNKLPAYALTYIGFPGKILGAAQFTQLCNPVNDCRYVQWLVPLTE